MDYDAAVSKATEAGLELPVEQAICGATPWDPQLQYRINTLKALPSALSRWKNR